MEDKDIRDLPQTGLDPLGCEELNPVIAEVRCLEEHLQTPEAEISAIFGFEPLDWEMIDAMRERSEIDDPFYGMCPSDFVDEEDLY
jgi:hypothetical protein